MKKWICIAFILSIGFTFQVMADEPIGVFANMATNCIQFIDPLSQTVSDPLLKGDLGTGELLDVCITSDGKTAVVSNFGDSKIFFIDISGGFAVEPTLLYGEAVIPFFAEDMVISPNDKYVLVTDGGFSARIAVVDIATRSVFVKNLGAKSAQAIDITPDGKIVFVADYSGRMIHSYAFDSATGTLTFQERKALYGFTPVNVTVSPDGRTLVAVCAGTRHVPVFAIYGANNYLHPMGFVRVPNIGGQSCVFSKDGTKAYYLNNKTGNTKIAVLNVNGPGSVTVGTSIPLSIPRGSAQLYGVDTLAIDPSGNYLYVTNPVLSGGVVEVTVIDLATNTEVNQLRGTGIPAGIAFGTITSD